MEHSSYDAYTPSGSPKRPDIMHRNSGSTRSQSGEIEQVVTRLLRTTKALLEALTQWSQQRASTAEILDFRETLETQFHMVSQAFEDAGVAMSDLSWIPRQLKESVSAAMNEEPSPATLDQHLPRIRDVIVQLLHGLKGKQQQLRERDAAQMSQTSWSRDSYRSTDSWRREIPPAALARGANMTHSPPGSRPLYSADRSPPPVAARLTGSDYDPRMGMPRPSVSSENVNRMNYPPQSSRPYSPTAGTYGHYPMPQAPRMPSPSRSSSSGGGEARPSSVSSAGRGYPAQAAAAAAPEAAGASPPPPPPPPPPVTPSGTNLKPPSSDFDESDPNTASALAALKRQENLARRSSVRRASMFRGNGAGDYHPMKRQGPNEYIPPVPSIPARVALQDGKKLGTVQESQVNTEGVTNVEEGTKEKGLTLFLVIGKDVKKVHYTGELSIPALRMLFIERFGYSSGLNDFPSIYIKDPIANISYELEDLEEVKNNSVLSLNINDKEDKEEVQKYWAQEMNTAMEKEMSEIRKMFVEQVETIKQQLSDLQAQAPPPTPQPQPQPPTPTVSAQHQSATVSTDTLATSSEDASQGMVSVKDIKTQLRQVETIRRDIAVLRQLQREMRQDAESAVQELKDKAQELREKDKAEPKQTSQSEARAFIEEGKEKLLTSSDKITARLEDLQDTIDQLKLDVTQRKCRPSEAQMAHCKKEKAIVAKEIEEFGAYIVNVKPRWKKTWEQELQTIVKEQQMLKEQEGLLLDMQDDLTALVEVFEQLEKICAYQAKAKPVVREFHVAPAEEGFEGMSSVLKQVATIDVDHERRLRALDQAEKMRQRELDNRIDEFERELTEFVDSKKLKKTGGAEEVERVRQQKDRDMLRQLYLERQKEKEAAKEEE